MTKLARVWNRVWFAPASPVNLAAARVIVAVHALWLLGSRDFGGVSGLPVFWDNVRSAARWRYLLFPGHPTLEHYLTGCAAIALTAVLLGFAPRISCLVSALLLYHLAPLETIIWTSQPYERGLDLPIIALVILAASPCADALSVVPSWAASRVPSARRDDAGQAVLVEPVSALGGSGRGGFAVMSSDYRWPLVLIQLVIAEVYLLAGYSKLYRVGITWISSENIRRWLQVFNQQDQQAFFTWLAPILARHDLVTLAIAIGAVAFDFGFIFAVFSRRARTVLLPIAVAFHVGILLAMNIAFLNLPQLLVFVDWEALGRWRKGAATSMPPEVIPPRVGQTVAPS